MTLRDLFGDALHSICYLHYVTAILDFEKVDEDDAVFYEGIPEELMDRRVRRIAPRHDEIHGCYYLIRLEKAE